MKHELDYKITSNIPDIYFGKDGEELADSRESSAPPFEDYSIILRKYGLSYKKIGSYFQVGLIEWIQGWILDLSSVIWQLSDLLHNIVPILLNENVAFKIIQNSKKATSILTGEEGYIQLGKLISIYPSNEDHAIKLGAKLISCTASFKGPQILTDRRLHGILYTRYGAGNPVLKSNESGIQDKYIYDFKGNLIRDPYHMPFQLLEGITWPFSSIAPNKPPKKETVLQDKYKPMELLKEDARGYVKKGLWLKKIWQVKWCVIKEGRQYMTSDIWGRDISDRLRWQFELHKDLHGIIPIPEVYDLFQENGDSYLVMEYVKGISLEKRVYNIFNQRIWIELPLSDRLLMLDYIAQIFDIIQQMHKKGYIHRDITPVNFLINKTEKLWVIDLELSYNEYLQRPAPAFRVGTPGFMSPEQLNTMTPRVEQDIYAIGSLMIFILTGLLPENFSLETPHVLQEQLSFFIPSLNLIQLISSCFHINPKARPSLSAITSAVIKFKEEQKLTNISSKSGFISTPLNGDSIEIIIKNAIRGMINEELITKNGLWYSRTNQEEELAYCHMQSLSVYQDFYQGLSGVLYLLARVRKMGFSIEPCQEGFEKSVAFIRDNYSQRLEDLPAGLYSGTAGMAISFAEGISAGLIPDTLEFRGMINGWLKNEKISGCGVIKGLAGQALAMHKVIRLLGGDTLNTQVGNKVDQILQKQQEDGSWVTLTDRSKHQLKVTGWGHGISGILCFLLDYYKDKPAEYIIRQTILKALDWLTKQAIIRDEITRWPLNNRTKLSTGDFQEGSAGVVLCLIKAYELFGDPRYKKLAEDCLSNYPRSIVNCNLTLATGLAGLGEVYLEAARVFKNDEWQDRAHWIAQFFMHYFYHQKDGSCYWLTIGNQLPTASFMTGGGGVIHFLIRYAKPGDLDHPLSTF
ncbi:MAG: lanthionine synthetase LanC family protein [Puia sp.]|nr:lanthionine synthetase LanC family protein [Puia sp.]